MDKATGAILLVIGVVALFAAIVGGGVKIKEIEVGTVKSVWRQGLLGVFGLVVSLIGLGIVTGVFEDNGASSNTQNTGVADQNTTAAAPEAGNEVNATVENADNTVATDANGQSASDSGSNDSTPQQPSN